MLLHVEDDPDLARIVSALLDGIADVVTAQTMTEARLHIANEHFDLAVIDVHLTDGSGLDLLAELGDAGPTTIPVIIFFVDQVEASIAARVEATLVKSKTSNHELVQTIKTLIAAMAKDAAPEQPTP